MTTKEITETRKAGRVEEALGYAETEFARNENRYTAGALFWCLHDLYKKKQGEEAEALFGRMKELCDAYGQEDEFMASHFMALEKRRSPQALELDGALRQAKAGRSPVVTYQKLARCRAAGELDAALADDFGWLIYYALKFTPVNDARSRKMMLAEYLSLNLKRPSLLHSRILQEAVKVEQNTPLLFRIRDFIRLWGIENLTDDDWSQFHTADGKTLPSLVEKLVGVYAKEMKTDGVAASEEMMSVVDRALGQYPNSQNLPYFKATMLISLGRNEEALAYYRDLILRFPTKFYLWHQASALVDDTDTKTGLLCKALSTGDDESFLGGVRLALATVLVEKGMHGNAKAELDRYQETYMSRGWSLRPEFRELCSRIPPQTVAEDNAGLYERFGAFAERFIYSAIPSVIVIKIKSQKLDDRNHPGRSFIQWTLRDADQTYRLKKPARFGLDNRTPNGTVFEIKNRDGKIVWIQVADTPPALDWLKTESGTVQKRIDKNGNNYCILKGVYVASDLLRDVGDGDRITVLACRQNDGRWSAVKKM